jgi:hypothetical protein
MTVMVVSEKLLVPRVTFQCPLRGSSSGWIRAVTNRHRHRHRDPNYAALLKNDPLIRACRLRHHSRYRHEQGCAPELV